MTCDAFLDAGGISSDDCGAAHGGLKPLQLNGFRMLSTVNHQAAPVGLEVSQARQSLFIKALPVEFQPLAGRTLIQFSI
jgi:hypothetical protein